MNYAALRYVAETCTIQGAGRALLFAIAYRADNKQGHCTARLSRLANEAGMSYATAKRAKALLLGCGEIEIVMAAAGRHATCLRIVHATSSGAQSEPVDNSVEGSNENRRGLNVPPVEGSDCAPPYRYEGKDIEGFEGSSATAATVAADPTADAVGGHSPGRNGKVPLSAETTAAIAQLRADTTARRIADQQAERARLQRLYGPPTSEPERQGRDPPARTATA